MTARMMQHLLQTMGVAVRRVHRRGGHYFAEFYHLDMREATDKATVWAERITQVLPDATIIVTHDTIASWRKNHPVIFASVVFSQENVDKNSNQ